MISVTICGMPWCVNEIWLKANSPSYTLCMSFFSVNISRNKSKLISLFKNGFILLGMTYGPSLELLDSLSSNAFSRGFLLILSWCFLTSFRKSLISRLWSIFLKVSPFLKALSAFLEAYLWIRWWWLSFPSFFLASLIFLITMIKSFWSKWIILTEDKFWRILNMSVSQMSLSLLASNIWKKTSLHWTWSMLRNLVTWMQ